MTLGKLAVILILLIWVGDSTTDNNHRSKRNNEYILRRCTATAELIRKHRNGEIVGASSRKAETEDSSLPQVQRINPESAATLSNVSPHEISSSVYRRTTHMRRRGNAQARRVTGKHLADTPLRTLHIDVPQDRPSAFRKKNPLPELSRDMSGRKIDSSPHMIIIKPVT